MEKRTSFKKCILSHLDSFERFYLTDPIRQKFNENSKNSFFFETQNKIFESNTSLLKKLFALNYLEESTNSQVGILLGINLCTIKKDFIWKKFRGYRFKGKCSKCKEKMINLESKSEEKDVIFKRAEVEWKKLKKLKPKKFLRTVGKRVKGYHRDCYVKEVEEKENLKYERVYSRRGTEFVEEGEDDLMSLLNNIHSIKVERDYLGAMSYFDSQNAMINDEVYNFFEF